MPETILAAAKEARSNPIAPTKVSRDAISPARFSLVIWSDVENG